jgi:hypothetical protein
MTQRYSHVFPGERQAKAERLGRRRQTEHAVSKAQLPAVEQRLVERPGRASLRPPALDLTRR